MVLLVLKTARYVDPTEVVELGELLVFLGHDYVITVRHGTASELAPVREALESDPERLRKGPGVVLHAILDRVVDDYGPPSTASRRTSTRSRRSSSRSAAPIRPNGSTGCCARCSSSGARVAPWSTRSRSSPRATTSRWTRRSATYFRDVNDHLIRARDQLDGMHDLLASSLQANLAQVGIRQNEDMRRISAWVAIIAVPTAVAGIYGMNFEHMPELTWTYGYPAVLLVMLTICSSLYWYFRRSGWL